jgi:hypothetical protein
LVPADAAGFFAAVAAAGAAAFFACAGLFALAAVSVFFLAMSCNSFRVAGDCIRRGFCLPETARA